MRTPLWLLLFAGLAFPVLADEDDAPKPMPKASKATEHQKEMARRVKARFEAQFKQADANADGKLSREEAEKGMPYVFSHFDASDGNKDGFLSMEEISAHNEVVSRNQAGKGKK